MLMKIWNWIGAENQMPSPNLKDVPPLHGWQYLHKKMFLFGMLDSIFKASKLSSSHDQIQPSLTSQTSFLGTIATFDKTPKCWILPTCWALYSSIDLKGCNDSWPVLYACIQPGGQFNRRAVLSDLRLQTQHCRPSVTSKLMSSLGRQDLPSLLISSGDWSS